MEASISESLKAEKNKIMGSTSTLPSTTAAANFKASPSKTDLANVHKNSPKVVPLDKTLTAEWRTVPIKKPDPKLKKVEKSQLVPQQSLPMNLDELQYINEKLKVPHKETKKKLTKKSLSERDLKVPKATHSHHHHKKDKATKSKSDPPDSHKKNSTNSLETINEKKHLKRSISNGLEPQMMGGGKILEKNPIAKKKIHQTKSEPTRNVEIKKLLEFKRSLDMKSFPGKNIVV